MNHLGRWLSALVDGELDNDERDRVLNHLAGCRSCLAEANDMRALKRRLTALGDTQADTDITDRLIYLASHDRDALDDRTQPAAAWPSPPAGPALRRALQVRKAPGVSNWRTATGAAGTALIAIGFAAFLLGSAQPSAPVPRITPAVDAYWPQHGYDTDQEPVTTPGSATLMMPGLPGPGVLRLPSASHQVSTTAPVSPVPDSSVAATPAALTPGPSGQPPGARTAHHSR